MQPDPSPRNEPAGDASDEGTETFSMEHGKWTHSHEEDHDGLMVFRPASFSFPRSRGRLSFILEGNGLGTYLPIGADDRHGTTSSQWRIETTNKPTPASFLRIQVGTKDVLNARIVKASPDELVLRILATY
ncbi:MAG: hypothetical protein FJ308_07105 [Planctomycetes bacterium]|nr:hypothetical protein [Planctomycetota bacterium]